jgi:hypothetical protein
MRDISNGGGAFDLLKKRMRELAAEGIPVAGGVSESANSK